MASAEFDIAVIGAGVVGCALARRFALAGARVLVLEKSADILDGASKGNSGLLHTGFDAPPNSLELACIQSGYQHYQQIRERLKLPLLPSGALVVAWNEHDDAQLNAIRAQALANGVVDVQRLSASQLAALEPELAGNAVSALQVPGEAIIDPWSAPLAYLQQALANGAELRRGAELIGAHFEDECWQLHTGLGERVSAATVINCAGLYGDQVDTLLFGSARFQIRPRKGQFLVFDKSASRLLRAIILPVPSATTKGVVVCRTIYGNVLVGPTAEEQQSRDDASVDQATLRQLYDRGVAILPGLANCSVTATYAGIRPASECKDYRIHYDRKRRAISVGGIRSTGLSAALGIADIVYDRYCDAAFGSHQPIDAVALRWPPAMALAEHETRDWAKPDNGGIVCHCELVTRREVEQALSGPLAATTLGGLKRRTRVTMGRCQGFYCLAALSELTAGKFCDALAQPLVADDSTRFGKV